MKTIIAEKPSVAREIARIIDAGKREEGYYKGAKYCVTWALGHLVGLALPEAYGHQGFVRDSLPIIPETFMLVPRQTRTEHGYKPDKSVEKQLAIIRSLFDKSDGIIAATDAGCEGELIFRNLYAYLGCRIPFERLWISSLTEKAIRDGLNNLKDGHAYDNLYHAARARSEADWLVGINGTQALTIAAGRGTYSVGRVQTPTLAMVCTRYYEHKSFTPEVFWQLHLAIDTPEGKAVKLTSEDRWKDKDTAHALYDRIKSGKAVRIVKIERKEKTEEPPLLYDLTALQKDANVRHGLTAEQTLSIAQKLYESKFITYPRTSSRYIPEDVFETIPALLDKLHNHEKFGAYISGMGDFTALTRRSVDAEKVTDHHARLITGLNPIGLYKDELTVYNMIAGRMIEVFSAPCIKDTTAVYADCCDTVFAVKGSIVKQKGWRAVSGEEDNDLWLPDWKEGDMLSFSACSITEGKTKPKPLHTEATLLSNMETAGKEIEDEALHQAIKDCGIGTPATRAAIIETLLKREYIIRIKKSLVPTEKGLALYSIVKTMDIANVELTGRWEAELAKIEKGCLESSMFMHDIETYTRKITSDLLASDKLFRGRETACTCPKCRQGAMRFYAKVVRCDNEACALPVFRQVAGRMLSDTEMTQLLTAGKTDVLKGFKSKQGKSFDVALVLDENFDTKFVFPETKNKRTETKKGGNRAGKEK